MLNKSETIGKAIELSERWQKEIEKGTSKIQAEEQNKWANLVRDQTSKSIVVSLFDQAFRSERAARVVDQFIYLIRKHGIPKSFTASEKFLLLLFGGFGKLAPSISLLLLKKNILLQTSKVVLDDDPETLSSHVTKRKKQNTRLNLNLLGELVLGEDEALNRLEAYRDALKNPEIDYISIKISCIGSQLRPLAHRYAKRMLKDRLALLFQTAIENPAGSQPKFVNLDMEEYKDMRLTFEIFTEVLEREEFRNLKAGIAVQAYLPDAFAFYSKLSSWAKKRMESGGAPIKVRLVKGANLQMEKVESSIHGWECPVFDTKVETDANYKKILETATLPENMRAVHLGVASHNLFDIAYATVLAEIHQTEKNLSFEMLEGISESSMNYLRKRGKDLVLYAPVAGETQFINAITYLIRRLDENTGEENFLRHAFDMKIDSESWRFLKRQFVDACRLTESLDSRPKRKQNRSEESYDATPLWREDVFTNEAETDFHLDQNLTWAEKIKREWQPRKADEVVEIPVQIGTESERSASKFKDFFFQNGNERIHTYRVFLADRSAIRRAVRTAEEHHRDWSSLAWEKRCDVVSEVANRLRKNRGKLIGVMARTTAKVFGEGDNEVTEAVDFAEYYPYSLKKLHEEFEFTEKGKGIALVIAPWNFPTAIPAGGVLAALVAGNCVILKPAPEAVPVAWELAKCIWDAGVPKEVFQLLNCDEGEDLKCLVEHPSVKQIIFTGGTDTLYEILKVRNDILVSAETGGKNAMIVTSLADWDKAVKDVVQSAFSNSGQKCSAASLLILEKELFESESFKRKLADATRSLICGGAFDLQSDVGSLVSEPGAKIEKALNGLESGEEWLVEPEFLNGDSRLLRPSIKWNVRKESFAYQEELFAPILSVMRAENFEEALELVNAEFGLTSGLQSLDEREIEVWKNGIQAGNLYVNRGITGAVVQRQPFGGFLNSKSAFGTGVKAGGPNYVLQLMEIEIAENLQKRRSEKLPEFLETPVFRPVKRELENYQWWLENLFTESRDVSRVLGQDNRLRYLRGAKPVLLRLNEASELAQALLAIGAMHLCGIKPVVSADGDFSGRETLEQLAGHFGSSLYFETEREASKHLDRVCMLRTDSRCRPSKELRNACARKGIQIFSHRPFAEGRAELIYYLQEQSISEEYHRYGNLGFREASLAKAAD